MPLDTGMMAVQFGKKMGAKLIAVSKDTWIKTDFGADYINGTLTIEEQKAILNLSGNSTGF